MEVTGFLVDYMEDNCSHRAIRLRVDFVQVKNKTSVVLSN